MEKIICSDKKVMIKMLNLNDREWKEFYLRDIFPEIQRGKRLKTADHVAGNIPYVSSSSVNNGVDAFIGNACKIRKFNECLTLANSGSVGKAFYHNYEFIASDHVTALKSDKLSKYSYIFIATIVQRLEEKYSFNREINDMRINKEKILLPVNDKNMPDYAFMEQYIKEREKQIIQKYISYIGKNAEKSGGISGLTEKKWKEFSVGDLFIVKRPKARSEKQYKLGEIPFVASGNVNNGVIKCCNPKKDEQMDKGNCITVSPVDGSAFYQETDFLGRGGAGSSILMLYNADINKYSGLFLSRMIRQTCSKYSYGKMGNQESIKREKIMIPIDEQGNPDYAFMEEYSNIIIRDLRIKYLKKKIISI